MISAVGHEPDVTIADYVADLRAATPSNAAELAVPDCDILRQQLDSVSTTMQSIVLRQLQGARRQLKLLADHPTLQSPARYISQRRDTIQLIKSRLVSSQQRTVGLKKQHFISLVSKLDAMSPLKVLTRGYAMVQSENGAVVRSVSQLKSNDNVKIKLSDGDVNATIHK